MGRRLPSDWVNWGLYRRAWVAVIVAWIVLTATSFRPDTPPPSAQPPAFSREDAAALARDAEALDESFPDRRVGTPGAINSAQWVRQQLAGMGLETSVLPGTTTLPGRDGPVGVVDVVGTLPGRTAETVVVLAPRDTSGPRGEGSDSGSTATLLALARHASTTRDRRRTYLFVSTDAAAANGAGARVLAEHLTGRQAPVFAAIALSQVAAPGAAVGISIAPSGPRKPPIGLAVLGREAVAAEGEPVAIPGSIGQMLRLGIPVTLREHGQLLAAGLPAITVSAGAEQAPASRPRVDADTAGQSVRAVQRMMVTLDDLDAIQSAGKTWAWAGDRVWRGWALKILLACLLLPVWVVVVDMFVRYRRQWALVAAAGSTCRAMLAGIWGVAALWALSSLGVVAGAADAPPSPQLIGGVELLRLLPWALFAVTGWLLARGPDWQRQPVGGRDHATLLVGLAALCAISVLALALNPYAVIYAALPLHAWLWLCSRRIWSARSAIAVWLSGGAGPAVACAVVAGALDTGAGTPSYVFHLVAMRGVSPGLGLLMAASTGVAGLVLLAALDRVHAPALHRMLHGTRPRAAAASAAIRAHAGSRMRGVRGGPMQLGTMVERARLARASRARARARRVERERARGRQRAGSR